jgi:hypothetical protein
MLTYTVSKHILPNTHNLFSYCVILYLFPASILIYLSIYSQLIHLSFTSSEYPSIICPLYLVPLISLFPPQHFLFPWSNFPPQLSSIYSQSTSYHLYPSSIYPHLLYLSITSSEYYSSICSPISFPPHLSLLAAVYLFPLI